MANKAMHKSFVIVSLYPSMLNANGDAENARVLVQRARWAGIGGVRLVHVESAGQMPDDSDMIVVGACGDPEVERAFDMLTTVESSLREAALASVPMLAVGTGWGMLSRSFAVNGNPPVPGLALFSGSSSPRGQRVSDDLVVDSVHGQLVGYENHADSYLLGAGEEPLGSVVYGTGNGDGAGSGSSTEGAVTGSLMGTHLHGPVLARNPSLADHLVALALARSERELPARSAQTQQADDFAANARAAVKASLEL